MSSEKVISAEGLGKCYHVYERPQDRLRQFVLPRLARFLGRPSVDYFRPFWALEGVSFEVSRGETVGIIGRNGSGKSTLLQMLCGTLNPSQGSIAVRGRVAALLELGSGFNPEFTGRENVYLNASILGLDDNTIAARYEDIIAFADIGDFIDQPVKTYSSGMAVRLAFAVIAHVDADLLVIDEALAVGDAFFVQKCMRFLRRFMETGTVLFVSHDTGAILNLCNRAIWLDKGRMAMSGSPKAVVESYMKAIYEHQQGASVERSKASFQVEPERPRLPARDMRTALVNGSQLRNDIEVFSFNEGAAAFGKGGATVENVELTDQDGHPLTWIVGGEPICLIVECRANDSLPSPILGFSIKDRLGQDVFVDNTFLSYAARPIPVMPGERLRARFEFTMPVLPTGDYTISAAVAEGTQQDHVQHHWINDALAFKVHASRVMHGLIGVPMTQIRLEKS